MNDGFKVVKKLTEINSFQVFYTDYTEILYDNGKNKVYLITLLDHADKLVACYALEKRKNTDTALKAVKGARSQFKEQDHPPGSGSGLYRLQVDERSTNKPEGPYLILGERCQGKSLHRSFSQQPRESKDMFLEARNIWELKRVIKERIEYYNQNRTHSTLGQVVPLTYLKREKILPEETESLAQIGA